MKIQRHTLLQGYAAVHGGLDRLLYALSTYALPLAVGLVSLVALFVWDNHFPAANAQRLAFRALETSASQVFTPEQARAALQERQPTTHLDTRLTTEPFWVLLQISDILGRENKSIDFPSRHGTELTCWDATTLQPLGYVGQGTQDGALHPVKAGFAMDLADAGSASALLCKARFNGPARMKVLLWPTSELHNSTHEFQRNSGLLDGGLIVLALFVLTTALINRSSVYLLFSAWLIINLRMGALSAGWDMQWLGHTVPLAWLQQSRLITCALYYVLTITLFCTLFREDLQKVGYAPLLRFAQWTCLPLLVASALMSFESFLPFIWISTGLNIGVLVFFLVRILMHTRSRVAMWYSASIVITLFASLYEVISAALGIQGLIGAVNSVTAALSSSLLASLAIAEQMRQEHLQRIAAQDKLVHTFDAMPIGMFTLDRQGRFTSTNPALREMLGSQAMGSARDTWSQYFHDSDWIRLQGQLQADESAEFELHGRSLAGVDGPKRYLVKAVLANDKIEGSLQDVTESSRATEELQFMAHNDALTKVFNRRGIELALERALATMDAEHPLALAYLDLDRFKLINDLFGHSAGDEVLQQVCERVRNILSGSMALGRIGGDEFLVLMPDTRMPLAEVICQGIVSAICGTPYRVGDKAFHVRGSMGLIEIVPGTRFRDAVSTADRACREAKARHTDGLVVYEKNAKAFQDHQAELQLVELLSGPRATDGLFLQMQPIMSLSAPHASLNFEVLLRMRDASGNVIPTYRVITAGENSGRMGIIDRWVLSNTLAWLNTNISQLRNTRFVCMNLSGASLNDEKFMHDVYALLAQNIHVASYLCFEITESVALHDLNNTRRFIDKVRSYGAKVALDDFGAGYTSFSYLKELPADLLKIDGSFIVSMNKHPANVAIVEAIVNLGRNLGMRIVAEWAEDVATVRTLVEIGVDYVQGFAVARPQAPERLLTASSSASFIEDAEVERYAASLGRTDEATLQVDLFEQSRTRQLH
jgi:diguanylate cyclase (GGDEF)-like protein